MNRLAKQIVAMFVGLVLVAGSVVAKPRQVAQPAAAPQAAEQAAPQQAAGLDVLDFASNESCYVPSMNAFVLIDSIDCAVDLLVRDGSTMNRIGRFTTDVFMGRHDLKNILRPVSVSVMGDKILVLASSQKDSSYLAVISMEPVKCMEEGGFDSLKAVSILGFPSTSYGFQFNAESNEILVVGKTSSGYNLNAVSLENGLENIATSANFHYHVPKQSERIQASDPVGVGLTVVAICVVFFALICICFIMKGYGAAIMKVQNRKAAKNAVAQGAANVPSSKDVSGEVYAAIAAAIYAYDEDMHDEEDTVITIQKVERAWTPWNAKFYNMNKYFSSRK